MCDEHRNPHVVTRIVGKLSLHKSHKASATTKTDAVAV